MPDQQEKKAPNAAPVRKSGSSWFGQLSSGRRKPERPTVAPSAQPAEAVSQVEISYKPVAALNLIYQFSNWVERELPVKELMDNLVRGLVLNLRMDYAAYYVVNPLNMHVDLQLNFCAEGYKPSVEPGYSIAINNDSILGWVYNQQRERVVYDLEDMPFIYTDWIMPTTASEATFPILANNQVVGLIDLQSHEPDVFVGPTLDLLRTLTIFTRGALSQEFKVTLPSPGEDESGQVQHLIKQSESEVELFSLLKSTLTSTPFVSALFSVQRDHLALQFIADAKRPTATQAVQGVALPLENTLEMLQEKDLALFENLQSGQNQSQVLSFFTRRGCNSATLLGVPENDQITYILAVGGFEDQPINSETVQPLVEISQATGATLQNIHLVSNLKTRLMELEALSLVSKAISVETNLSNLFQELHEQVKPFVGEDVSFSVAIYDNTQDTIEFPYMWEEGKAGSIPPYQLGEGLTSIIVRTRQPLFLVKDTIQQTALLGAKVTGKPARSWMGVPLILDNDVIGAMIVQDLDHEERFDEGDLHLFETIAPQVAVAIRNAQLFNQVDQSLGQHQMLHRITVETAAAQSVDDALNAAVKMLNEGLPGSKVAIFLLDKHQNLVVQSSAGFHIGSVQDLSIPLGEGIIGSTAQQAVTTVVNDVSKSDNYLVLDSDVQSEMAVPITFMGQVLGVLDIEMPVRNAFLASEVEIIGTLGSNLGAVISSARLLETVRLQVERQQQLFEATNKIRRSVDMKSIIETSALELGRVLGARRVDIKVSPRLTASASTTQPASHPEKKNGRNSSSEVTE